MRLLTYGPPGAEAPGVLINDDWILPLLPVLAGAGLPLAEVNDILGSWSAVEPLVVEALAEPEERVPVDGTRLGPPVPRPGKIIAIGFNYPQHGDGLIGAFPPPGEPVVFLKPPTSICGPHDPVIRPPETTQLDYEAELCLVIGRAGRRIARSEAISHVAGYMIANDVTARDVAFGMGLDHPMLLQIARGKGFDSFCPTGPWLLTRDAAPPASAMRLHLSVNGQVRQDASVADMYVDVAGIVASVSATMHLLPGDLILTGTPAGCGFQLQPPVFLNDGDRIRACITGLGTLESVVRDEVPV